MPIYFVSYDLIKDKNYQKLWDEFSRLKGHRVQLSGFLVNLTTESSNEVVNHFKKFVDSDDSLFAVKTTKAGLDFFNAKAGTNDWLSKN